MTTWPKHVDEWKDCQRCPLARQRDRICLARGSMPADVVIVGEAPGASEDALGLPFVGPAGKLLDDVITRALPPDVPWIMTNLVACFPRDAKAVGDNQPDHGEILECRPRVVELVNLAQPRLIVRVGKLVQSYLNFDNTVPFVDVDHPAYILRMPMVQRGFATQKCVVQIKTAWEDVAANPRQQWRKWGPDAEAETERKRLRRIYDDAARRGFFDPDDDIPF